MLVNLNWLNVWCKVDLHPRKLADALTMIGLEVQSVSEICACDENIVIGQITQMKPIKDSNSLILCTVDVSQSDPLQIVCGAPNAEVGGKYPVALAGSVISDGKRIETIQIAGYTSSAMLCSEKEIGLSDASEALYHLDSDAAVGTSINEHFQLPDHVLDIDLTPNRGDCLSIRGIAREVSLASGEKFHPLKRSSIDATISDEFSVNVIHDEDCPVYCGRLIRGIDINAKTPDWMRSRLQHTGFRCIHPIVDITNYVMMELGQPMHAFDVALMDEEGIVVRRSKSGEKLTLLNEETLEFDDQCLLITDKTGPIGLAGVMGGLTSGIMPTTADIFLEAAFFTPQAIRRSVAKFAVHSDASHRFERGVDPTRQAEAIERASELIVQIAGGSCGPIQEIRNDDFVPVKSTCLVRRSRVEKVLGVEVSDNMIESILNSVNKESASHGQGWEVTAPPYRFDLEAEHDQIEEIARVYGYDNIPSTMRFNLEHAATASETTISDFAVRETLHSQGYYEAITYSFVDPQLNRSLHPSANPKTLSNPIADNMSVMRTSLWPGLVGAFAENYRRQKNRICLYEIGRVFLSDAEVNRLGGIAFGESAPVQWGITQRKIDFFDVKGHVMRLFDLTRKSHEVEFVAEPVEGLMSNCSAVIKFAGKPCGKIGKLDTQILDDAEPEDEVFAFEIDLSVLAKRQIRHYESVSPYPSVVRDLSVVVSSQVPIADLTDRIRESAGEFLENLTLFDVYYGVSIDLKAKSVAFRLTYRSKVRTLTDSEVDVSIAKILKVLDEQFGAKLRA